MDIGKKAEDRRMAFLVDGDNASATMIEEMLAEASRYGQVIVKRVYGNWSGSGQIKGWRERLQEFALVPVQQFPNISNRHGSKNATDIALIIDAMDLLHDDIVNGFCIVSTDSDFTSLAIKIREHGVFVLGIGREETHLSFRNACDVFVSTKNLGEEDQQPGPVPKKAEVEIKQSAAPAPTRGPGNLSKEGLALMDKAFEMAAPEGFATGASIGNMLRRLNPSFDYRTYKIRSLRDFIEGFPQQYEIDPSYAGDIMVRRKTEKASGACQTVEVKPSMAPSPHVQRHRPLGDAVSILLRALDATGPRHEGALLSDLKKTLSRHGRSFDPGQYGMTDTIDVIRALPAHFITTDEEGDVRIWRRRSQPQPITEHVPVKQITVEAPKEIEPVPSAQTISMIRDAIREACTKDGPAYLPTLSKAIKRKMPDFDPQTYGKERLVDLIQDMPDATIIHKKRGLIYVGLKEIATEARSSEN